MNKRMRLQTAGYGNESMQGPLQGAAHLFQPLHVFEVESNIKKAEIRIYKLKLQDRNVRCHRGKKQLRGDEKSLTRTILMMRFFS